MGPHQSTEEEGGDHRGGAPKAHAAWPQWGMGVPHPLPPSSCSAGGEDATNVDVQWPDGP